MNKYFCKKCGKELPVDMTKECSCLTQDKLPKEDTSGLDEFFYDFSYQKMVKRSKVINN